MPGIGIERMNETPKDSKPEMTGTIAKSQPTASGPIKLEAIEFTAYQKFMIGLLA